MLAQAQGATRAQRSVLSRGAATREIGRPRAHLGAAARRAEQCSKESAATQGEAGRRGGASVGRAGVAYDRRDGATGRQEQEGYPELLLDVARKEPDDAK